VVTHNASPSGEETHLPRKCLRDGHRAAGFPECTVSASRQVVVEDQEVTRPLAFGGGQPVVFPALAVHRVAMWKQSEEPCDAALNEMQGRGLQRIQNTCRRPEGHAVAIPRLFA